MEPEASELKTLMLQDDGYGSLIPFLTESFFVQIFSLDYIMYIYVQYLIILTYIGRQISTVRMILTLIFDFTVGVAANVGGCTYQMIRT